MGIREELSECHGDELLFADGYDDAIIGVAIGFDSQRVVYDVQKMIEVCMNNSDTPYDEAANTPIYVEGHITNDN